MCDPADGLQQLKPCAASYWSASNIAKHELICVLFRRFFFSGILMLSSLYTSVISYSFHATSSGILQVFSLNTNNKLGWLTVLLGLKAEVLDLLVWIYYEDVLLLWYHVQWPNACAIVLARNDCDTSDTIFWESCDLIKDAVVYCNLFNLSDHSMK